MKPLLVGLVALAGLVAAAPASGSSPLPWCGSPAAADRLPDATSGFSVHVAYVRPADRPDRLAQWAPRIVGDVAAVDAWLRTQDASRELRFDLLPFACPTTFGRLDITSVQLPQSAGGIDSAFTTLRLLLAADHGFTSSEKVYLVYYDGSTEQADPGDAVCGQGAGGSSILPGLAVVFLDSCLAEESDDFRPIVAAHELFHVFGAVAGSAPNTCPERDRRSHVCDSPDDLMNASLTGRPLEAHVLDAGRDDYYGHGGFWRDVQDSLFLERLDSPDRAPPAPVTGLTATDAAAPGLVRLSWRAATDDVGPVTYRVYQDGRFVANTVSTTALLSIDEDDTSAYTVRAADPVGHLGQPAELRFRLGVGIVDAAGRLLRDTVPPPAVRGVSVRRTGASVVLSWPAVRDSGGIRLYRVRTGGRTLTVARPRVTLARSRVTGPVSVEAVDRAGNVGPRTLVPLRRS